MKVEPAAAARPANGPVALNAIATSTAAIRARDIPEA
jgi:hypothetical protein